MTSLSQYGTLRNALLAGGRLVVGVFIHVLWPPCGNHRHHERDVTKVFDEL